MAVGLNNVPDPSLAELGPDDKDFIVDELRGCIRFLDSFTQRMEQLRVTNRRMLAPTIQRVRGGLQEIIAAVGAGGGD